jgi:hypothetical protein
VIEEPRLPKRLFFGRSERDRNCSLQPVYPPRELKVIPAANEQMKVIGHHDKSANRDTKFVTSSANVGFECVMGCA